MSYSLSSFGADPPLAPLPEAPAPVEPVVRPIPLGWWLVGGAVALYFLWPKAKMTPNLRRHRGAPVGLVLEQPGKTAFGRTKPPARYARTGARRPSDYAWPAGYMYPIHTASFARAAVRRFRQHGWRYSPSVRATIATNIRGAMRRFGIKGKL